MKRFQTVLEGIWTKRKFITPGRVRLGLLCNVIVFVVGLTLFYTQIDLETNGRRPNISGATWKHRTTWRDNTVCFANLWMQKVVWGLTRMCTVPLSGCMGWLLGVNFKAPEVCWCTLQQRRKGVSDIGCICSKYLHIYTKIKFITPTWHKRRFAILWCR